MALCRAPTRIAGEAVESIRNANVRLFFELQKEMKEKLRRYYSRYPLLVLVPREPS